MATGTAADFALQRIVVGGDFATKPIFHGTTRTVASTLRSSFGKAGGAATALLFAGYDVFQYMQGDLPGREITARLVSDGAGFVAGTLASAGTVSLVAMYGTASTGAAITSLSGAAATNATLAYLGGGSLASGGLGVAGGTVILTGGACIVFVAAGWLVYKGFQWYYQREDERRDLHDMELQINAVMKLMN